uniref:Uncharacterized protein n=1 Tax=Amazona collaria TaxID=241587 RepID=A0A8B9F3S4_9PSIT
GFSAALSYMNKVLNSTAAAPGTKWLHSSSHIFTLSYHSGIQKDETIFFLECTKIWKNNMKCDQKRKKIFSLPQSV